MTNLTWSYLPFDKLSATELYRILNLRNRVFVLEQNCLYNDTDDKDRHCVHVQGYAGDRLLAYARIVPPGISYQEPALGRIVTDPQFRKQGLGKELMKKTLEYSIQLFPGHNIKISAQTYLTDFYTSFGFISLGEPYLEDGIPHIEMLLPASGIPVQ